jgi:hypothetical protein
MYKGGASFSCVIFVFMSVKVRFFIQKSLREDTDGHDDNISLSFLKDSRLKQHFSRVPIKRSHEHRTLDKCPT